MKALPSLTLFFPMYNERETVARMVSKALAVLETLTDDYEVVVVDDASCDGSEKIAEGLAQQYPQVRVVRHAQNRGYGTALRTGLASATKELVFYTDCDEPVDLEEIERALALIGPDVDVVVGFRIRRYDTLRRHIYSRVYNALCRFLFGIRVRDINFSFKLLKQAVLAEIRLSAESVFIDGELLAEVMRHGYHVVEIPVEYSPRRSGKSSFDSLAAASHTLQEILVYWWRLRSQRGT